MTSLSAMGFVFGILVQTRAYWSGFGQKSLALQRQVASNLLVAAISRAMDNFSMVARAKLLKLIGYLRAGIYFRFSLTKTFSIDATTLHALILSIYSKARKNSTCKMHLVREGLGNQHSLA